MENIRRIKNKIKQKIESSNRRRTIKQEYQEYEAKWLRYQGFWGYLIKMLSDSKQSLFNLTF